MLVQEQQRTSLPAIELQPEEKVHRDALDLCLVSIRGPIRKVAQATVCKHRWVSSCFRLQIDVCIIAHSFLLLDDCNCHFLLFVATCALSCQTSRRSKAAVQCDTM